MKKQTPSQEFLDLTAYIEGKLTYIAVEHIKDDLKDIETICNNRLKILKRHKLTDFYQHTSGRTEKLFARIRKNLDKGKKSIHT